MRYVEIADRLCERGWFGQKTGRGFYLYEQGARVGTPDPEVEAIVESERLRVGISPRSFTDDEIVRRLMCAVINEAANVVREGIALRPLDVDVALIYGYGFPRYRGGPMKYADTLGLPNVLAELERLSHEDAYFWKPSPLIVDLVQRGADFASLNGTAS
jgi:3-hydroxyacyl-CoA dehydrogenase